jgi:NAD(P)-dependent dehydrogenase (short-subunit alcohol dehydrogenase family)
MAATDVPGSRVPRPMSTGVLNGATAVVIGGAGTGAGLGRGLVHSFASEGMRLAILDADLDAASALAEFLKGEGTDALACRVDVTSRLSLEYAASQVSDVYGACNILCAHVGGGGQGAFEDLHFESWREAMDLMVLGTVASVQAFLPLLRKTRGPRRIVLTSSVAALAPGRFQGPYRAAKAAVTSIGETLDLELGPEGIGTTIAFPAGMLAPEILDMALEAIGAMGEDSEPSNDLTIAIAQEMMRNPADLATGEQAAEPIVEAVLSGSRYVVTHGVTAAVVAHQRHEELDRALAEAVRRAGDGIDPLSGWSGARSSGASHDESS